MYLRHYFGGGSSTTYCYKRVIRYLLIAAISFSIGRTWGTLQGSINGEVEDATVPPEIASELDTKKEATNDVTVQVSVQAEFQHLIQSMLTPPAAAAAATTTTTPNQICRNDSTITTNQRWMVSELEYPKDGFASEFQYMARLLQMSVSTRRLLVLTPQWKSAYEPHNCRTNNNNFDQSESSHHYHQSGWDCLWEPLLPACTAQDIQWMQQSQLFVEDKDATQSFPITNNPLSHGILPRKTTSTFFDVAWYNQHSSSSSSLKQQQRVLWAPISFARKKHDLELRPDVIPRWERAYGRYWIRAQMAHALWRPNAFFQASIDQRLPSSLLSSSKDAESGSGTVTGVQPFIGFHIRLTDNVRDLERHFARNARQTRSFSRFMKFAERIRRMHDASNLQQRQLGTIYLATDNQDAVEQSKDSRWKKLGWTFVTQSSVQRSTADDERLWFADGRGDAAGAIAADVEVLRRADYLVGSFQSNVYRLACQLNTVWHTARYPWEMQRHWTVDVEWYEDP